MYRQVFLEPKIFIFLNIILEIDLDIQTVVPRLSKRAPVNYLPGVRSADDLRKQATARHPGRPQSGMPGDHRRHHPRCVVPRFAHPRAGPRPPRRLRSSGDRREGVSALERSGELLQYYCGVGQSHPSARDHL